jgi:hypothetical protein
MAPDSTMTITMGRRVCWREKHATLCVVNQMRKAMRAAGHISHETRSKTRGLTCAYDIAREGEGEECHDPGARVTANTSPSPRMVQLYTTPMLVAGDAMSYQT